MGIQKRDSAALKRRIAGCWSDALYALAPELAPALKHPGENVKCPIDGDVDGFRVFKDVDQTGGGWKQNWGSEGSLPDGISLLMAVTQKSFTEVFDDLAEWVAGYDAKKDQGLYQRDTTISAQAISQRKSFDDTDLRRWLTSVWDQSMTIDHMLSMPAQIYLDSRDILDQAYRSDCFKFHPKLAYKLKGKLLGHFPALLAVVRNNAGHPVALHRTFLTAEGTKLNLGDRVPARMQTPTVNTPTKGLVVSMGQQSLDDARNLRVIGVAEGLETALSVMKGTGGLPCWSVLSASHMPAFRPPKGVEKVLIFADNDRTRAGVLGARKLKDNLAVLGISAEILMPELPLGDRKSVDWADQFVHDTNCASSAAFDEVADLFLNLKS